MQTDARCPLNLYLCMLTCQDELEKLNSIVWPAVRQLAQTEIQNAANKGNLLVIFVVSLLLYAI